MQKALLLCVWQRTTRLMPFTVIERGDVAVSVRCPEWVRYECACAGKQKIAAEQDNALHYEETVLHDTCLIYQSRQMQHHHGMYWSWLNKQTKYD